MKLGLPNQFLNTLPAELAELFEAAGVVVGEFVVVEAEEFEEGDVQIADVVYVFDGCRADFICRSDGVACFTAAAGEPDRHGIGIVIAAVSESTAADSVIGRAAEFPHPDDERFLEQAPFAEIFNECGDWLVDRRDEGSVSFGDVVV